MYDVSAQDVHEHLINAYYYFYYTTTHKEQLKTQALSTQSSGNVRRETENNSGLVKANLFDILSRNKGVTESCSSDMRDE